MWLLVLGILAVFAISFIYSNLGMGGGILFVPLLFWISPTFSEDEVVVISLWLVLANCLTSLMNHHREKLVDWKLGIILASGGILGSIAGALFNISTGREVFLLLFLGVVLAVIIKMFIDWFRQPDVCEFDDDRKLTRKRLIGASTGTVAGGFMAGCLGLGGGVINVPILMYVLGRQTKKAAGTSFVIMLVAVVVGIATFIQQGTAIHFDHVITLAPVVFLGSFIGSRWGIKKLKCREVQLLFILVLAIAVVKAGYDFMLLL